MTTRHNLLKDIDPATLKTQLATALGYAVHVTTRVPTVADPVGVLIVENLTGVILDLDPTTVATVVTAHVIPKTSAKTAVDAYDAATTDAGRLAALRSYLGRIVSDEVAAATSGIVTPPASPGTAATIVRQNTGYANTGTSLTVTMPVATATGNTLLIGVASDDPPTTPSGFIQDAVTTASSAGFANGVLFRKATTAGETSWSVSIPTSTYGGTWWVAEVSGLTATPLDQTATIGGSLSTAAGTGTTGTTVQAYEMAVAVIPTTTTSACTYDHWTNSFVEVADLQGTGVSQKNGLGVATRNLTAAGAYTAAATLTTSVFWSGLIVTYKVA